MTPWYREEGHPGSAAHASTCASAGICNAGRVSLDAISGPSRPPSHPVVLRPADRSDRAVLENLGQHYRHDLSGPLGLLPNADGTFNNRRLDMFRTGADPEHRAWLITVAGGLGGFVMTRPIEGDMSISDFFIVRALRRTGVGSEVARQVIAMRQGPWRVGFQRYNPGVERFWTMVAAEAAGDEWTMWDDPPVEGQTWPPDTWIRFTT